MRPDEEADDGNGDTRCGDERVTKNRFAGERGNDFADHTHGRQNHDVHGRMGVKPEEVLEENRVAAESRVEEAEVQAALETDEEERDGDDRSAEDEDDAGGVLRPNEERQSEPDRK